MAQLTVMGMKAYVPAIDHQLSRSFYEELGFTVNEAWGGNYDCRLGNAEFRLQDYYVEDWANNFMLQFDVEDATAWYDHARSIINSGRYPTARVQRPSIHNGALITHVIDPAGVLLIFIQPDQ